MPWGRSAPEGSGAIDGLSELCMADSAIERTHQVVGTQLIEITPPAAGTVVPDSVPAWNASGDVPPSTNGRPPELCQRVDRRRTIRHRIRACPYGAAMAVNHGRWRRAGHGGAGQRDLRVTRQPTRNLVNRWLGLNSPSPHPRPSFRSPAAYGSLARSPSQPEPAPPVCAPSWSRPVPRARTAYAIPGMPGAGACP